MFLEYDWTFGVYRPRLGRDTFIAWRGFRSFESMDEAKQVMAWSGCRVGAKTDSRTWKIEQAETAQ